MSLMIILAPTIPKEGFSFAKDLLAHPWLYVITLICVVGFAWAFWKQKQTAEQLKQAEVAGMLTLKGAMESMAGKLGILNSSVKSLQAISNRGIVDQLSLRLLDRVKEGLLLESFMQSIIDLPQGMAGNNLQNHCARLIRALPENFNWDKRGQCGAVLDRESVAVLGDSRGQVDGLAPGQLLADLQWDYLHTGLSGKPLVIDLRRVKFMSSRAWGDFTMFLSVAAENNGGAVEIKTSEHDPLEIGRQTRDFIRSLNVAGHGDHITI